MYIRTKDGIYKITDCQGEFLLKGDYENVKWIQTDNETSVAIKDIINQSENLEELCDNIVYNGYLYQNKITWDNCIVEDSFEELEEPITDEMIKDGIYGAIWTSKGLIYVAKMNDKGKLELI